MIGKRNVLCAFVAAFALQAGAQDITITGTVTDSAGSGIARATVSLMSAGISTTSDSNGTFSLLSSTGVGTMQEHAASVSAFVAGGAIRFFVDKPSVVQIDVYSMRGRLVFAALDRMLGPCAYLFSPADEGLRSGVYFVKVRIGAWPTVFRITLCGPSAAGAGLRMLEDAANRPFAKKGAVSDTLVASKCGYYTLKKFISSYTFSNQVCVLSGSGSCTQSAFDLDSLGLYDDPETYSEQIQTAASMDLFWKNYHDLEFVFLGSSHTKAGIDCGQFVGTKILNMGYAHGGMLGLTTLVRQYILPNCPKIKLIGFSATPYWLNEQNGDISWNAGIAQSKGFNYDMHHNFWKFGKPPGFDTLIAQQMHYNYPDDVCGLAPLWCQNWGGDNPPNMGETWTSNDQVVMNNFDTLESFISELNTLHIHFLVINFPESPAFKNTPFYSYSGLSRQTGEAVMQKYKSFEQGYQYYHFYDAYNDGDHDYADSEAYDYDHLCPAGARKLSHRLDSLIHTFLTE